MYISFLGEIIIKNEERGVRSSYVRVFVILGIVNFFVVLSNDIYVNFVVKIIILLIFYVLIKYMYFY